MQNSTLPIVTGDTIRRLRKIKGIKQADAAKKMGFTQQAYSKIENSQQISTLKLEQLLTAFNSNVQELSVIINFTPPRYIKLIYLLQYTN